MHEFRPSLPWLHHHFERGFLYSNKEAVKPDTPKILVASMDGMIAHCEQSLKEHKEALVALKAIGFN